MGVPGFSCVVDADLFLRAAGVRAEDPFREYLAGIRVEPCAAGGALLIATDGKRMLVIRDPEGECAGAGTIVPTPSFLAACRHDEPSVDEDGDPLPRSLERPQPFLARRIRCNGQAVAFVPPKGDTLPACFDYPERIVGALLVSVAIIPDFPDWRRVIPSRPDPSLPTGAINPVLLVEIKAALTTRAEAGVAVAADAAAPLAVEGPHLVIGDGKIEGFGVVMPTVRAGRPATALPDWLDPPAATPGDAP